MNYSASISGCDAEGVSISQIATVSREISNFLANSERISPLVSSARLDELNQGRIDPTMLICACLNGVMKNRQKAFASGDFQHLSYERKSYKSGSESPTMSRVKLLENQQPKTGMKNAAALIDRRASGILYCPSFDERGKRLSVHIAVIKTCWGINSHLNAVRLNELLQKLLDDASATAHEE